jgi:hypothetical protein
MHGGWTKRFCNCKVYFRLVLTTKISIETNPHHTLHLSPSPTFFIPDPLYLHHPPFFLLRINSANNLPHNLIIFHRFMTFPNISPVNHTITLCLKFPRNDIFKSMFNKFIFQFLLIFKCSGSQCRPTNLHPHSQYLKEPGERVRLIACIELLPRQNYL